MEQVAIEVELSEMRGLLQSLVEQQAKSDDDLWDAGDIARHTRLTKASVQSTLIRKEGFPRAVRLQTTKNGLGGRRWVAKEVKAWLLRFREA